MAIYEGMPPDGHLTFTEKIFTKIKNLFDTKVQTDVPANAVFTDEKVTQTESTTDADYEVLVSGTASTVTTTEGVNKSEGFKYNSNKHSVMEGQLSKASGQRSHAEGYYTSASGYNSHSEGQGTFASGSNSHSEGYYAKAIGVASHAEGNYAYANGDDSHAEGYYTYTNGSKSHAEGYYTTTKGKSSHSEGYKTLASGSNSHAEGSQTTSSGEESHSEGIYSYASGNHSHAEGYYTCATGYISHAEGECAKAFGDSSHTEGSYTYASTSKAHAEGEGSSATNIRAHAEGGYTLAAGANSHSEGYYTTGYGDYSHAEGYQTCASGYESHSEGNHTWALGNNSHAEGLNTYSSGYCSHTEGEYTTVSAEAAHAEGNTTIASGSYAHAEGSHTTASGIYAHAEGDHTIASGDRTHTEGNNTTASGNNTHAEGYYTIANHKSQHVFGEHNLADSSTATASKRGNYIEIVGNGLSSTQLSNARTLDWNGNEWVAAGLSVDGLSSTTEGETSTTVQTSFAHLQNKSLTLSDTTDTITPSETEGEDPTIETETHAIEVTPEDIILNDTWDGSRTSLKEAVTFLGSQSAANKVDKAGDTMTGGLNFANNTWNVVGDDVQIGDKNVSGHLCIQGVNGETGIRFMKRNDDSSVCNLNWNGTVLATSNSFQCNGGNIKAYVNSTGESQVVAQRQTTTTYIFANADGRSGVYSNKGNLLILDSKNKLSIGGQTYAIGNAANFRSALGLGSMATQNTGSYPTTTTVPSGYRVRAGTKVVTVTNAQATVVFTQAQVDAIVGVSGCTMGNTVVYVANGDYGAQSHYISACIYNPSNKTWCIYSVMNGAFSGGNFRANYIIIRFA